MSDEKERTPRRMIFRAQSECLNAIHQYRRARLGTVDVSPERARRELHAAVMTYWDVVSQYRTHGAIKELWTNQPVGQGQFTLEQLRSKRATAERQTVTKYDAEVGQESKQTVTTPWCLDPQDAFAVRDLLDRCVQELGLAIADDGGEDEYTTKRDPEEYDEPINDDVPRPT